MLTQSGEIYKSIPIYFINDIDIKDISLNLAESLMQFDHMSNLYEEKLEIQSHVLAMQHLIGTREVLATNAAGDILKDKLASGMGIDMTKNLDPLRSNNYKHLEEFIKMNYYGQSQELFLIARGDKNISMNKVVHRVVGLTAMNALAFNLLQGVNQITMDELSSYAEAAAGQHHTRKEWIRGKALYWKYGASLQDIGKMVPKTILGKLIDLYDPVQGDFTDQYGKKVTGSEIKKRLSTDMIFFLQHGAEHEVNVTRMITLMLHAKPKNGNGKYVTKNGQETDDVSKAMSLFEAYEAAKVNEDGTFTLPHNLIFDQKQRMDLRNKLHAINKYTNGIYNNFDKSILKRRWYGPLFTLFRGWMTPGMRKRWGRKGIGGGVHVDEEVGAIGEGTFHTFSRMLRDGMMKYHLNLSKTWQTRTPMEKQNIKRTLVDLEGILATFILQILIAGAASGDEDDDSWAKNMILYQAIRLRAELMAYINPKEAFRMLESPIPTTRMIVGTFDLVSEFIGLLFYGYPSKLISGEYPEKFTYKRDTGQFEKGDLKAKKKLYDLIPVLRGFEKSKYPEEATKWLTK